MEKIKNFFKYFFASSNRGCISIVVIFIISLEIFVNGVSNLLAFIFNIPIIIVGTLIVTIIERMAQFIFTSLWHNKELTTEELTDEKFLGMLYANFCAFLFLYFNGHISW